MSEETLINKIENLLQSVRLRPEAQISSFQKYKTALDIQDGHIEQAVVDLTNSLGVQLRNDVQFSSASRAKTSSQVPVLNLCHLENLESFQGLTEKLKELPSEWTVIQISKELCVLDILGMAKEHRSPNPTLLVTRLACGDLVDRVPPYLVRIPPPDNPLTGLSILDRMQEMIKIRRDASSNPQKKLQAVNNSLDAQLVSLVNEVESYWLREWRYILGGCLVERSVEDEIRNSIDNIMKDVSNLDCKCKSKCSDILLHLVTNAHSMKEKDLATCAFNALYDNLPGDQEIDGLCHRMLEICMDEIKELNTKYLSKLQKSGRHPVILITEPSLELFPWEMTCSLAGQSVSRVISFHFLYALFKHHESNIHNGYRHVSINSGFCLLNPEKNLDDCEKKMGNFLKKELSWIEVTSGVMPDPDEIIGRLSQHSLYLYCGHGSGSQYFKKGALRKALVDALVLLYGCSSNMPQSRGGRTPFQNDNTYTYLTNGCPCTVGALFVVSSTEADRASMKMLSSMLPTVSNGGQVVKDPVQPDVLKALQLGKSACQQYWTKSCLIARGIPVKIVFNKEEKASIINILNGKT